MGPFSAARGLFRTLAGVLVAGLALAVSAPAQACICPPGPDTRSVRTFPDDGVEVPPNARFWVWLPPNPAGVKARAARGDSGFVQKTCQPGDPLCVEGPPVPRPPRTAGAAKHPPIVWPESLPKLRPFLWRWPEGGPDPTVHTVVAATIRPPSPEAWDQPWEIVPSTPLLVGERYAIALGPSAELSFPWAAFHARGAPDVIPPTWKGPQHPSFDDAEKMGLGTCGDGGRIVSELADLTDASSASGADVLLLLQRLAPVDEMYPEQAPFFAKVTPPRLVFGSEHRCDSPLLSTPGQRQRPFTVQITPVDVAGNRGRPYRLSLQADGNVVVEPQAGSSPEGDRAEAVAVPSAIPPLQPPAQAKPQPGPPPRLARFGPAILVFIVVFVALRLVWRRHRARSLDRV